MVSENKKNVKVIEKGEIISQEELLNETKIFKNWSGPYLIKVLRNNVDGTVSSLGSGGLLKYKDRYFAVTNEHVVRSVDKGNRLNEINIPYKDAKQVDYRATIIAEAENKANDLAAFEIRPYSAERMQNHQFLDEAFLEVDVKDYLSNRSNIVFTHGYPALDTVIDEQKKKIDLTTLPYTTFIESYDDTSDVIMLHAEEEGISELGSNEEIFTFGGMSGSLVYGYYRDEVIPYKCLGVLSFWEYNNKRLGVFPVVDVINFLDNEFF